MEANRRGKRPARVASPPPPPPSTGGEEEEEQMEKFYALLGNLRAMKELRRTNPASKRPRKEEPLWRPTFVREDFIDGDEAAVSPGGGGGLDASKAGEERGKGKEKEEGGEVEDSLDLSLAL